MLNILNTGKKRMLTQIKYFSKIKRKGKKSVCNERRKKNNLQ
jgi:hypothetical protein